MTLRQDSGQAHWERVSAALRGAPTGRVPVALWRHFPNDDLDAGKLAARVVEFQQKFDFDLVKITPASGFTAEMYGATLRDAHNREGTRAYVTRPVNALRDWDAIAPLDLTNPVIARELVAVKRVRAGVGPDVPILQTVFSPLTTAQKLAGERFYTDLREHPDALHRALGAITQTTTRFAVESVKAGARGIFFATQMATRQYLTLDEYREFGERYDLPVLEAIRAARADFVLLHIHGLDIYFDLLARYPVDALNWHDRRTAPSLKEAREILRRSAPQNDKALVGGINEWDTLAAKPREEVIAEARDAIAQTDGRGFILSTGCVIPVDTPEENVRAVMEVVGG